jgi:GTP-binding protein HflX
MPITETQAPRQRAGVIHVSDAEIDRERARTRLDEAVRLAAAIDLDVVLRELVVVRRVVPATYLGKGKVDELKPLIGENKIDVVIVDTALSPVQQRNLERVWKCKVIDRTGLILEIFGERARTREGVLQVELAALGYQRSRLVRSWTHLERQRGGLGFVGGPGESQIELDRRRITERITKLKRELEDVRRTRSLHRDARNRYPYPVIALVGYTNAGKSTLFNRLTGASVEAVDKLFATLDPTMRMIELASGRRVILADTVGFISDLPTTLVAAFRATLEEVLEADIVLHVRDGADPAFEEHKRDVETVLEEIGIDEAERAQRVIEVINKIDLLDPTRREALDSRRCHAISAVSGEGLTELLDTIDGRLDEDRLSAHLELGFDQGAILAWLHEHAEVTNEQTTDQGIEVNLRIDAKRRAQLEKMLGHSLALATCQRSSS